MNRGEICARLYSTGQPVRIAWRQGLISEIQSLTTFPDAEFWVGPALFDLQINGFAGVDFQQDSLRLSDLLQAIHGLRAAGCGRFFLTLMTDRWEVMLDRLRRLRALRAESPLLQSSIAGWHFEGPFLSSAPGFCGAHNPDWMRDPSPRHLQTLRAAAGNDAVLLTLAPERRGSLEAIAAAVAMGIKVSLGHTNASCDILTRAVKEGATGFTHFANACPQLLDRHDNILWRVLDASGLTLSLIPDGHHVSPALFRVAHRCWPADALYYTTDAVSAAGAPPGRYTVGSHEVEVGLDQVVRQPGQTNFTGSGLRPIDGVFRAAEMLRRSWQETWDCLSLAPARFLGHAAGLESGRAADLCVFRISEAGQPEAVRTFVGGEELA